MESQNTEMISIDDKLRFGPLGEKSYLEHGLNYAPGDDPRAQIAQKFEDPLHPEENKKNIEARAMFWEKVSLLDRVLSDPANWGATGEVSANRQLREIVFDVAVSSFQGTPEEINEKIISFRKKLEAKKPLGLFEHSDETKSSGRNLFGGLEKILGRDKFIPHKHVELTRDFYLDTHDVVKILGPPNAQIDPDHEVIYSEVFCKNLVGKMVISDFGKVTKLTPEDILFLKKISTHEDIRRENSFANLAEFLKKKYDPNDLEVSVARHQMIFHLTDIFDGALYFNEEGVLQLTEDEAEFHNRFEDLVQRHINLPIIPNQKGEDIASILVNWDIGKAFRPEWVLHGIAGMIWTFEILEKEWGVKISKDLIPKVQSSVLGILNNAISSIEDIKNSGGKYEVAKGKTFKGIENELNEKLEKIVKVRDALIKEIENPEIGPSKSDNQIVSSTL